MKTTRKARKDLKDLIEGLQSLYDKGAKLTSYEMENEIKEVEPNENWRAWKLTGKKIFKIEIFLPIKNKKS